jgi:hypothetical protein
MLARRRAAACLLNSHRLTLPVSCLVQAARVLLKPGERVVLGPAEDGGYYRLGMRRAYARLFADIAWSTGTVADTTRCDLVGAAGVPVLRSGLWRSHLAKVPVNRLRIGLGGAGFGPALRGLDAHPVRRRRQALRAGARKIPVRTVRFRSSAARPRPPTCGGDAQSIAADGLMLPLQGLRS